MSHTFASTRFACQLSLLQIMCLNLTKTKVWLRLCGMLLAIAFASGAQAQRIMYEGVVASSNPYSRSWVDVNNDGKDDYCMLGGANVSEIQCYLSSGSEFQPRVTYTIGQSPKLLFRWVDINGDGQVDFCRLLKEVFSGDPSSTVQCRLGPTFASAVSVSFPTYVPENCPTFDSCDGNYLPGAREDRHLFFSDVNQDGMSDFCYLHLNTPPVSTYELRCMLSTGSAFAAASSTWIRTAVVVGNEGWPQGFYDVNGDGFPDFCRINGTIRCILGSAIGFSGTANMDSGSLGANNHTAGSDFVDINGDGKADFCRFTGTSNAYPMSCRLSTGSNWQTTDVSTPPMSNTEVGHAHARWWADVNGDGLPDFCRAVGPDPSSGSRMSNLWCRLARGGDATTGLFGRHDFKFESNTSAGAIHFGVSDGGRAFCDPFGTGIQTLCRATYRETVTDQQQCYEGDNGPTCWNVVAQTHGIAVGLYSGIIPANTVPAGTAAQRDEIQARPGLLASYSDGLGAETRITYMPLSSNQVYARSGIGVPRVQIVQPRSPVVFETRAWRTSSSVTLTGNARYFYKDLRIDNQSGSRGFRERWFLSEGSNTIEHAIYYQGLGSSVDVSSIDAASADPAVARRGLLEIGQPKEKRVYAIDPNQIPTSIAGWTPPAGANARQLKLAATMRQATTLAGGMSTSAVSPPTQANPFMLLKRTTSTLGESVPFLNQRFRPVVTTRTEAWDWNDRTALALPIVDGSSTVTDYGNVTNLVETTTHGGQVWRKATTNAYGADNVATWTLGRLTKATVISTAPDVATQLAANGSSVGSSPNAGTTSSSSPVVVTISAPTFPATQTGQTSTGTATLSNTASNTLVIVTPTSASVAGAGFSFVSTTCSTQLPASGNCTVTLRFAPTAASTFSGAVTVDTASGPRTASFTASSSGAAAASTATLTSAAPNLGNVTVGTSPAPMASVTFRNDGSAAMTLTGLSGLSSPFQVSANNCGSVAPASSCSMSITMLTSAAGAGPNAVSTVGATNNASFNINGSVTAGGTFSTAALNSATPNFGTVNQGTTPAPTFQVTFRNDGNTAMTLSDLAGLPSRFTISNNNCFGVPAPGTCSMIITMLTNVAGAGPHTVTTVGATNNVSFTINGSVVSSGAWTFCASENGTCTVPGTTTVRYGANGTYFYRTVTGSIGCYNDVWGGDPVPVVVKSCDYSAAPSSFSTAALNSAAPSFGTVNQGTTPAPTFQVTFRNDGNTAMTLSDLAGLPSRFTISNNNCFGVPAPGTCSMIITMLTNVIGAGPHTVTTVGATNNVSFAINGSVTASSTFSTAALNSAAPNFGTVNQGTTPAPTSQVTFRNDGNTAMTLSDLAGLPSRFTISNNNCIGVPAPGTCSMIITMLTNVIGAGPHTVTTVGATNNVSFAINGSVVAGTGWTFCASENGVCTVPGTATVRYGANGTYFYRTVTGSIGCYNDAWGGDPAFLVVKSCEYQSN
jgi:FG-GAP-like repeat